MAFKNVFLMLAIVFSSACLSQEYPNRTVKVIVGYPAGSSVDLYTRNISSKLQDRLKQAFVVENRVGAAGTVAAEAVVHASPDGYTLLSTASQIVINPFVQKISFNTEKDLVPIAQTLSISYLLVTSPNFPANNLNELVDYVRKNPKKFNYGSYGNGSGPHLAMAMLQRASGIEVTHVQYRGSGQMLTALMANDIQMSFDTTTATLELIKARKLKAIAIGGPKVVDVLPSVQPIAQLYPGFNSDGWQGIFAPANTPSNVVRKLNLEINQIIQGVEFRDLAKSKGVSVSPSSQAEFADFVKSELKRYEQIVKENNIYLD
ncbi:tripartite tricarboxylate transporter substrate binding protein [Polynucleobacter sp. TSB-Sco08W16]|uniref:Bug family tripartite tricarboxylate transporter substrate binding protein n=1 Tax=Polynucleobacter sp. TSB-Sco08W16 TaxID=1758374 RepID=UPI001BFDADFD|nr:tripartite tricarboxylate transporter substrate binding protein [Polynucleobacter sp. TSB-Sco08W16]QWD73886.1 tripartite tricarboxylate transporter substrate binding protein [Polynucleobacter sp. TSB-Sco08W16]